MKKMKEQMKINKLITASLLGMSLFASPAFSESCSGGSCGGGGDPISQEFSEMAQFMGEKLSLMNAKNKLSINLDEYFAKVQAVKAHATNEVLYVKIDGRDEVKVIRNEFPYERVLINRTRWSEMTEKQKRKLTLHEIFLSMGLNDKNYEISAPIFSKDENAALDEIHDKLYLLSRQAAYIRKFDLKNIEDQRELKKLCYYLTKLELDIKAVAAPLENGTLPIEFSTYTSGGARLKYWQGKPKEICVSEKIYSVLGTTEPVNREKIRDFLLLVERDAEIYRDEIVSFLTGRKSNTDKIWVRYRAMLANSSPASDDTAEGTADNAAGTDAK